MCIFLAVPSSLRSFGVVIKQEAPGAGAKSLEGCSGFRVELDACVALWAVAF